MDVDWTLDCPILRHHNGTMKVGIYSTARRGETVWVADWTDSGGKRHRKFLPSEKSAKAHAASLAENVHRVGVEWLSLTPREQADAVAVAVKAKAAGVTLSDLWAKFGAAVDVPVKPLGEAIRECVLEKRKLGRRPAYVTALEYTLDRFSRGRESVHVASVTDADCRAWLDECRAAETRAAFQSRLSTFCAWCVQRGFLTANPCDRLGRVSIERKAPVILSPDQVDAALAWVAGWPDFHGYLVLGLFAGIRPDELQRLDWSMVDLARGLVTISEATSKVRRRRIVPLAPRALAILSQLLSPAKQLTGPIWPGTAITLRRRRRALARAIGFAQWPADLLRHTAASYMLARDHDAGKVARILGNSPGVLLTRYTELVGPEDAARFWAI
jgi:integrase